LPDLGLFPLNLVLMPGERVPLHIFEPRYRELIGECLDNLTEFGLIYQQGVARPVLHVDVISLYPSIMLTRGIAPAADTLGAFAHLLRDLRDFRVAAKQLMRVAESDAERRHLGALQQTFKILINSFYGYLGFSPGHWNDFEAANRVTAEGRVVVTTIVDRLQALGRPVDWIPAEHRNEAGPLAHLQYNDRPRGHPAAGRGGLRQDGPRRGRRVLGRPADDDAEV